MLDTTARNTVFTTQHYTFENLNPNNGNQSIGFSFLFNISGMASIPVLQVVTTVEVSDTG